MLNIYSQFNDTDHIAIIPPYIANYARNLREAERKVKLLKFNNIDEKKAEFVSAKKKYIDAYESLSRCIPKNIRNNILNKRVIIYITNPGKSHWCCTFVFNFRTYLINIQNASVNT